VENAGSPFAAWGDFYVIVGSSGAALIGLQFVVIALIAQVEMRSSHESIKAFGTPTIVHFAGALFVSATMCAPWPAVWMAATVLKLFGLAGVIYAGINVWRAQRQIGYKPVWEDWLWHSVLPFIAYSALMIAAFVLRSHPLGGLFEIAGAALLLLFIGIHNSWDTVTYIVIREAPATKDTKET